MQYRDAISGFVFTVDSLLFSDDNCRHVHGSLRDLLRHRMTLLGKMSAPGHRKKWREKGTELM